MSERTAYEGRHGRRRSRGRTALLVATPVALVLSGALVWNSTYAAFNAQVSNGGNSWSTGTVTLSGDDGSSSTTSAVGTALFTPTNLAPGATGTNCVVVTYGGSLAAAVKLYVAAGDLTGSAALAGQLTIVITEGTGGSYGSCTGFVAGTTIYNGTLAALATSSTNYATGVGTWAPSAAAQAKTYRVTYTLSATAPNSVQGTTASAAFTWEADNT
jgi:hypothetical protein